ncbi:glycosyltransferase family 2 protein [Candidatus Pelagibacter ubique]|jgi:glycosyltransferase involved in cell wall biosynthesis|nr:glycosyltransferase family 2 protein [Candidatus Pelagibacter ubique]
MKLSLILLAHNEEANIKDEIENLYYNIASKVKECEVIICEDGSSDQTKKIISDLNKVYNFEYLSSDDRKGVSKAMIDGFKKARGEYIFFSDAGKKFNFNDFWKLYNNVGNYDLVSGVRVNRKDQKYRIILTYFLNLFLKITINSNFKDIDSGFKIFNKKKLLEVLSSKIINTDFLSAEICLKFQYKKFRHKEVEVDYFQRNEVSKALPIYKIPSLIISFLLKYKKLRKELLSYSG